MVKGLTLTELEHVYDVRILLETEAACLGGTAVVPVSCARMSQLCDKMGRAVEGGRIVEAARNHDGRAAAAITRDSLLSAKARIEGTLDVS